MKYRTFGRLGWQVSEIGFGAWAIGGSWGSQSDDDSVRALHRGVDLGCNFIYTIFEQEPQAEFFPVASENNVGVIVRVAFDESALTGKLTPQTKWEPGDFRNHYFAGDRLERTLQRVEKIKQEVGPSEPDLAT